MIDYCTNCEFILGPCSGSLFIRDCSDLCVTAACMGLCLRDVHNADLFVHTEVAPAVKSSTFVTLRPLNMLQPNLANAFAEAKLKADENIFKHAADFNTFSDPKAEVGFTLPEWLGHLMMRSLDLEGHGVCNAPEGVAEMLAGAIEGGESLEKGNCFAMGVSAKEAMRQHEVRQGLREWRISLGGNCHEIVFVMESDFDHRAHFGVKNRDPNAPSRMFNFMNTPTREATYQTKIDRLRKGDRLTLILRDSLLVCFHSRNGSHTYIGPEERVYGIYYFKAVLTHSSQKVSVADTPANPVLGSIGRVMDDEVWVAATSIGRGLGKLPTGFVGVVTAVDDTHTCVQLTGSDSDKTHLVPMNCCVTKRGQASLADELKVGDTVIPHPGVWRWGDKGGTLTEGTVEEVSDGRAAVRWSNGNSYSYKYGEKNTFEVMKAVKVGSRVMRNPFHWKWGNQDKGGMGTVIEMSNGEVEVKWDGDDAYIYRLSQTCADIQVVTRPPASGGSAGAAGAAPVPSAPPVPATDDMSNPEHAQHFLWLKKDNKGILENALFSSDVGKMEAALKLGVDRNAKKQNETALIHYAKRGFVNCLALCIKYEADVNCCDSDKFTPLHHACAKGHLDVCKLLLENRANIEATDSDKDTPLHFACLFGHFDICKLLLENRANIEATDSKNRTPLHFACGIGHLDICKLLLENRANIEATTKDKVTPLHHACDNGHLDICKLLLENHANIEATTSKNRTPLHIACAKGHLDIKLLLENHANIEAVDAVVGATTTRLPIAGEARASGGSAGGAGAAPVPSAPPQPATATATIEVLGRHDFEVDTALANRIGGGGFGDVYKGKYGTAKVAVKVQTISKDACEREVKALSALSHPNVARCYGQHYCEREGKLYLVMDLLKQDVESLIKEWEDMPSLPWETVFNVLLGAATGLHYMHSRKFIHKDVKPANIMIDMQGVVKLIDLGLAQTCQGSIAEQGTSSGTYGYMAPEVMDESISTLCDVYSLGCTAWRMVDGRTPREWCKGLRGLIKEVATNMEPLPMDRVREVPGVPDDFVSLIERMTKMSPEGRPPMGKVGVESVISMLTKLAHVEKACS